MSMYISELQAFSSYMDFQNEQVKMSSTRLNQFHHYQANMSLNKQIVSTNNVAGGITVTQKQNWKEFRKIYPL